MNRRRSRPGPLTGLLCAALLAAGCAGSHVGAPAPDPEPAVAGERTEPLAEPVVEPTPVLASANSPSNVRAGPGTGHPIVFWVEAATEVTVAGRNAEGTWLRIEHDKGTGWIFAGLLDIAAEVLPGLPETAVVEPGLTEAPQSVLVPTATSETIEEPVAAPTPEPEAVAEVEPTWLTVTGNPVNLRAGPSTGYPIAAQVRRDDRLQVTGRNADGSWLQVADPRTADGRLWIYGPLTDINAAIVQTLAQVAAVEIEVSVPPEPEPAQVEPTPEPQAPPPSVTSPDLSDCTQWHTVNPNETRLSQITDWLGLDLAAVATLNGMEPGAPLTSGGRICLAAGQAAPPPAPATTGDAGMPADPVALPPGTLWWPPGSYADVVGLDYDFEIEWRDESTGWNWQLRDTEGCYDALRAFLEDLPARFGIRKFEVTLRDVPVARDLASYHPGNFSFAGWYAQPKFSLDTVKPLWPDWQERVGARHAVAGATCEHVDDRDNTDTGVFPCQVFVAWGQPGHLLDGVATHAIAKNMGLIGFAEDNDSASHWGLFAWDRQAYLTPVVNQLVVGYGACLHLTRQE